MNCLECLLPKIKKHKVLSGKIVPAQEGSCFCVDCQPDSTDPFTFEYGYFLPLQNKLCGDKELAEQAVDAYASFGFKMGCEHKECPENGVNCSQRYFNTAGRVDGFSIFYRLDGSMVGRLISGEIVKDITDLEKLIGF